jgi:hypothetical protein
VKFGALVFEYETDVDELFFCKIVLKITNAAYEKD